MSRESFEGELDSASSLLDKFNGKKTPCYGAESVGFYPFPSSSSELAHSKQVCQACPFRRQCLAHAVEQGETGIWGGFYLCAGQIRHGRSPFLGKRSVRTQNEDEMFEEVFVPIPVEKLDAFNAGEWDPPFEWYDDEEWDRQNSIESCPADDDSDDADEKMTSQSA